MILKRLSHETVPFSIRGTGGRVRGPSFKQVIGKKLSLNCGKASLWQRPPMFNYTVIRFLWVSARFGTCTVVSVNGAPVEAKVCTFTLESTHLSSTCVPFTLTTVQVPNLALTHKKRITVYWTWGTRPIFSFCLCVSSGSQWMSGSNLMISPYRMRYTEVNETALKGGPEVCLSSRNLRLFPAWRIEQTIHLHLSLTSPISFSILLKKCVYHSH